MPEPKEPIQITKPVKKYKATTNSLEELETQIDNRK